jgi:hypothetical protein
MAGQAGRRGAKLLTNAALGASTLGRGHTHPVRPGLFVPTRLMGKPISQALFIGLLGTPESWARDCEREQYQQRRNEAGSGKAYA